MTGKKKYEALNCIEIKNSLELCLFISELLMDFKEEIYFKDSNQLFQQIYKDKLIVIIEKMEELIAIVSGLARPKSVYFNSLKAVLTALNTAPNALIITAYHIAPEKHNKRLLNKHIFSFELNLIEKKINFTKAILDETIKGNPNTRSITRP